MAGNSSGSAPNACGTVRDRKAPVQSRCALIPFNMLKAEDHGKRIEDVAMTEGVDVDDKAKQALITLKGSPLSQEIPVYG